MFPSLSPNPLVQLSLLRLSVQHHFLFAVAFLTLALALAQLALHVAELAPCLARGFREGPGKQNSWWMMMSCLLLFYSLYVGQSGSQSICLSVSQSVNMSVCLSLDVCVHAYMHVCIDKNMFMIIYTSREWVNIPAPMDDGGHGTKDCQTHPLSRSIGMVWEVTQCRK